MEAFGYYSLLIWLLDGDGEAEEIIRSIIFDTIDVPGSLCFTEEAEATRVEVHEDSRKLGLFIMPKKEEAIVKRETERAKNEH